MEQHLTVREACKFANKSESTIKRLIREITAKPGHEDRGLILPSPEEVQKRKNTGDMFVWKINQDLLIKRFPKEAVDSEKGSQAHGKGTVSAGNDSMPIIDVLNRQLESKDRQIQTLETQLDRKDDQIKNLSDRMYETNVLMRELQNRLAIAAPVPQTPATDISVKPGKENRTQKIPGTEVSVKSGKDNRTHSEKEVKSKPKKSPSFFARLFGKH